MLNGKRKVLGNIIYKYIFFKKLQYIGDKKLIIFNYHRIRSNETEAYAFDEGVYGPTEKNLRDQWSWLKLNADIISESDLLGHIENHQPLSRTSVMLTFDDGYRDNADLALPLIKELNIPVTFFISTEAIDTRKLGWWDIIAYLIKNSNREIIQVRSQKFNLKMDSSISILIFQDWMRKLKSKESCDLINEISHACSVTLPENNRCSLELMNWDQIREAVQSGVSIGSHTHTHRVLSTLSTVDQEHEMRVSKKILEFELKKTIHSIAYPVGGTEDHDEDTMNLVGKCGYKMGFSFQTGMNALKKMNPYSIARVSSEESIPLTCASIAFPNIFLRPKKSLQNSLKFSVLFLILYFNILLPNSLASDKAQGGQDTIIRSGFMIEIGSPNDPKINGEYRVSVDGVLSLPYSISVEARGLRLVELKRKLMNQYSSYFNGNLNLSVRIKQKRYYVKVLGLIKSPGTYLVKEDSSLDEVLAMASVRTEDLAHGFVKITDGKKIRFISLNDYLNSETQEPIRWNGGEEVLFQLERPSESIIESSGSNLETSLSEKKVQVLGEVKNPGSTPFKLHADAYYYLVDRGGPTRDSNLEKVELIRKKTISNEHTQISIGNLKDITDIRESDLLIIYPDRPSPLEKGLQNAGIIATIVSAGVLSALLIIHH